MSEGFMRGKPYEQNYHKISYEYAEPAQPRNYEKLVTFSGVDDSKKTGVGDYGPISSTFERRISVPILIRPPCD